MIGNLFAGTVAKVGAGVIAVLLALLVWCWLGWSAQERQTETANRRLALSEAQHAVTIQSVETLSREMERMVTDGDIRKERLTDALAQAREDGQTLRDQADTIRAEGVSKECVTPRSVRNAGL